MIGKRLQRARKAAGLSLRELGEALGVSHMAVKKYEDDLMTPSSETLRKMAQTLQVRSEYFFRPDTVTLTGLEYRKRRSLSTQGLAAIQHEVLDQLERRLELEQLFPTPPVPMFTPLARDAAPVQSLDQVEDVADQVRREWQLGFDPIPDLIDLLEGHGIRAFTVTEQASALFDGLAAQANGLPIVVVGHNWPGDRQRFTLAHELGHLMLSGHLAEGLDEEAACNRFAGAFLFPRAAVLQELGRHRSRIELRELALLKEEFGLSMMAILYRVVQLGVVNPGWHQSQVKLFSVRGWRRAEPGSALAPEQAHVFEQLVFHALAEDYIGESKAAELLKMPLSMFRRVRRLESVDASADQ
jgi:Zn-dependent peptidase ImmA (M78 family)/transcriptional regulator with XRE-family HTH domain